MPGNAGGGSQGADLLELLLESAGDLVLVIGKDRHVRAASRSSSLLLGREPAALEGRALAGLVHRADQSLLDAELAAAGRHRLPPPVMIRFRHSDRSWRALAVRCSPVGAARTAAVLLHGRLPSAGDSVAEALQHSEQRFRIVSELASDFAYAIVVNTDGTMTGEWATEAMPRITGYSFADLQQMTWINDVVHPDDRPLMARRLERLLAGQDDVTELRIVTRSGELRWIRDYGRPEVDASGRVTRIYGAARDITEHKVAEELTVALLDVANAISGTLDRDELLDRVQRRAAAVLGCDAVMTFAPEPDSGLVRMVSAHGLSPELRQLAQMLEMPGNQPFGGTLERGEAVVFNDPNEQTWVPPIFYQHFGIGAFTAVPMRLRERYAGSLCAINFGGGRPFLPRQVELLAGIARQLAVALETAELYRHQREESEISAALARVSHQLLAWLDRPRLLDRFGRLSCEILECESSYTLLRNTEEGAYLPVHSHGAGTRRGEPLELVPVPLELFATIETALAHDDAVQLQPADFGNPIAAAAAARSGIQRVLFLALRSGYDLIGLHLACHHGEQRFSPRQIRLGRGMAQLASVALRNARLVQQLEGANRLKSDFVATMSHELRTPLNIVIGYNDLLREGVFGELNTEQIEALLRMQNSATNLLRLIDSTLDVSRLETGEVRLALQWVDVGELLAEIETEREEARRRPELLVEWSAPSTPLQMLTDRGKLKVIIKNLVGNAIKFTERGQVKVGVARLDDLVEIAVEDTGIGIAPEVLPVIFEPFRQGDSSDTRPYGGVGLGLYIVRRLVELLGGTIAVETAVGQGTTFRVRLPLTA